MMLIAQVMRNTHDNDNETWQTLGLATARLLQKMDGLQDGPAGKPEATEDKKEVKNPEHRDTYVDAGLKRIRDFESRYRNNRS